MTFFDVQVVENAAIPHSPPPRLRLPLQALNIAPKRVALHGKQRRPNACLICCRKLLKLFLREIRDVEVSHQY
jgi:hypothetical protein